MAGWNVFDGLTIIFSFLDFRQLFCLVRKKKDSRPSNSEAY